jgi:FdhE protein
MGTIARELASSLDDVKEKEPALADVVDLQRDLLVTSSQVQTSMNGKSINPARVQTALMQGIPLVQIIPWVLDWKQFEGRYRQVCQISANHRPDLANEFKALEHRLGDRPEEVLEAVAAALRVSQTHDRGKQEEEEELLTFVLLHALRPFLQAYAKRMHTDLVDKVWRQGYCPVCAGWPDLAYLEDDTRSRRLVCGRCDTAWSFPRVRCPYCGTSDPADLAYYPGQVEKYRLYICNHCRRYLKAFDTTYTGTRFTYPAERILTLALDLAAQEKGYHSGG